MRESGTPAAADPHAAIKSAKLQSYFAQALNIARDINAPVQEAQALEGIGRSHIREGNPAQGAAHLRQALAIYRRIGAPEAQGLETTLLS